MYDSFHTMILVQKKRENTSTRQHRCLQHYGFERKYVKRMICCTANALITIITCWTKLATKLLISKCVSLLIKKGPGCFDEHDLLSWEP